MLPLPLISNPAKYLPVLFLSWELLAPHLSRVFDVPNDNPFTPFLTLSHRVPGGYERGAGDIAFVAYHVVVFSLIWQLITLTAGPRVGRFFGLTRAGKLARFDEQGYAFVYFLVFGAWGVRIMSQLPTWWFSTEYFWIDYPHTAMPAGLKRYYLLQTAYWLQQFLVLVLGLERPRKDYAELVAHHFVTLFLVLTSYATSLTRAGAAVYLSMDIPDAFLALSKLLNYIQWNRTNNIVLASFVLSWFYFRHYLNLRILYSILSVPPTVHIPPLVHQSAFAALCLLQALNMFWGWLILRIVVRALRTSKAEDVRSDDEDGDEEDGGMEDEKRALDENQRVEEKHAAGMNSTAYTAGQGDGGRKESVG
ncbi:TLC domain-containing protein [Mycena vulgaris]|nr:TLC domain-containing protein [Mycena vulgaris]